MNWFIYKDDVFTAINVKALTIGEAVRAGLPIARDLLGNVDRYCLYEGSGEVIIEHWRGKELSVKLTYADDTARALMHYYNAERAGLIKCSSVS
jgi:hypothetical protein